MSFSLRGSLLASRTVCWSGLFSIAVLATACSTGSSTGPSDGGWLAVGTWGGDTGAIVVTATQAHVTLGCTYGDIPGPIPVDVNGHFSVSGSYNPRAFPVAMLPEVPAQFAGQLNHGALTLVVAVNDTIEKKLLVLGPIVLRYGVAPTPRPCPM